MTVGSLKTLDLHILYICSIYTYILCVYIYIHHRLNNTIMIVTFSDFDHYTLVQKKALVLK